ncbi:MAG: transposase [Defluviitaleaceae bacterium]|nr:transposase [Defluviitaleaceae bacterium]
MIRRGCCKTPAPKKRKTSLEKLQKARICCKIWFMRTNIIQHKKYSTGKGSYQLFLPLEYEVIIPENDSVRLLSLIMEELDYGELYAAYFREGRKPETEPKILAKVIIYSYMEFIYSTRKIEKACSRDINFMCLLNGESVPDHSTISRFRKDRLGAAIEGLFYQLIQKLCEMGEVKYEDVFVDGTKIEAASNRYTFVWKKAVEKNDAKMRVKVQELSEEILKVYHVNIPCKKDHSSAIFGPPFYEKRDSAILREDRAPNL